MNSKKGPSAEAPGPIGRSIGRVPDDRELVLGAAGGLAEIGVEPSGSELGSGQAERYVIAARTLRAAHPAGTDLDAVGEHPIIGLGVGGLAAVGDDRDVGRNAEGLELALNEP